MGAWPTLEPGVRVVGAAITVTLSDGTNRTVDIPAEYHPDEVTVAVTHVSGPARREVHICVVAGYAPSDPAGAPRSYYRTG